MPGQRLDPDLRERFHALSAEPGDVPYQRPEPRLPAAVWLLVLVAIGLAVIGLGLLLRPKPASAEGILLCRVNTDIVCRWTTKGGNGTVDDIERPMMPLRPVERRKA